MAAEPRYGQDIAAARWDWLDISCVRYAARHKRSAAAEHLPVAVDLGCGQGLMALTLQDLGYRIIACDLRITDTIRAALGTDAYEGDDRNVPWAQLPAPDIVYSQRALHYIPYREAAALLATLTRNPGCAAFISLSGYHSELAHNYPHLRKPVQERFAHLAPDPRLSTGISAPLCLYTPEDAGQLITDAGLVALDIWSSDFGNVKINAINAPRTANADQHNQRTSHAA